MCAVHLLASPHTRSCFTLFSLVQYRLGVQLYSLCHLGGLASTEFHQWETFAEKQSGKREVGNFSYVSSTAGVHLVEQPHQLRRQSAKVSHFSIPQFSLDSDVSDLLSVYLTRICCFSPLNSFASNIYVYIYSFVCAHVYVYAHKYTYICMYVYIYVSICIDACIPL